ncbi:MAG TPA: FAD-binding protein, partial [Phycisphaerae bacterium]|nr:FAD-binding protein [Phycisphaerae bacterium]
MDDVLVVGGGPAGLLSAWLARQRGAKVRLVAAGIGSTHIMPGWLALSNAGDLPAGLAALADSPGHPYALAGLDSLRAGIAALQEVGEAAGLRYRGGLERNLRLPTALGAVLPAAYAPESFIAGDLNAGGPNAGGPNGGGPMLIAGPGGWRDFYPALVAGNLARQGFPAQSFAFDLPEIHAVKFDNLATGLARLFDRAEVRERVGKQIAVRLNGAGRVGLPAVLGL